ncbi:unnamed protein product [Brassica rapa subsp. trilocularis]
MLRLASFQWKLLRAVSFLPEKSSKLNENSSFVEHVLLSLPCLTPSDLHAFEEAAAKYPSPKKQEQLMRSLLMLGTGNNLKALAAQKNLMLSPMSLKDRVYPQARQKLKPMKVNE